MEWVLVACGSAFFAGLVSIFAKLGVKTTDSDVATAIRTCVVIILAWAVVGFQNTASTIGQISANTWIFLILSGLATGGSWICYFKALSLGDVNKVTPIDKSSAVLASLLAIILFGETSNLVVKLICIALILIGTMMMIERKSTSKTSMGWSWLGYAVLAAVFAALTSIFGKVGIDGVDSNLGTAIRTVVVLIMSWVIVVWKGKLSFVRTINRSELFFLIISGLATGISWLCYYYAIQTGVVSVVVQIDKLSLLVSVLFAYLVLHEHLTPKSAIGLALITISTAFMTALA